MLYNLYQYGCEFINITCHFVDILIATFYNPFVIKSAPFQKILMWRKSGSTYLKRGLLIMIENLQGIHETVNYLKDTGIKLYVNDEPDNYPPHWHQAMEIIMPLEKGYIVECCDQKFELREGDIIMIFPYCLHTLYSPPAGKRIIFQPDIVCLKDLKQVVSIYNMFSPVVLITPEDSPSIYSSIRSYLIEIMLEYQQNNSYMELSIFSKLLSVFALLGKHRAENIQPFDVNKGKQEEYSEKFIFITEYIINHCSEDLTLEDIAELAGFSKFHFSRLFKQFTNQSFYQYLSHKRIQLAEVYLADPQNSVTDVALNSGFTSISSFIRMFKQVKGCTPTEFRQMYKWGGSTGIN